MTKYKIAYCTPSIYIAGGIERVLTTKANYFADVLGYDVYIILTDGKNEKPYFNLSSKITIIQLDINFEELWHLSFMKKIPVYLRKQYIYRKKLKNILFEIRPDFTISLLRREINFINYIKDGSKKIGELHVTKTHYRNFESNESNFIKNLFSKYWLHNLENRIKKLDAFVVLCEEEKIFWNLNNIHVITNPLPFEAKHISSLDSRQVIAVGRYEYQKGFDLLFQAWQQVIKKYPDWILKIYGNGNREPFVDLSKKLSIQDSCILECATNDIQQKYCESSIYVLSSRFEGFGMVIIEAMACGLPVIAFSSSSGPRSIIDNNINGILVENGNIDELAKNIIKLIDDKDKRLELQKNGFITVNKYNIENIARKWQQLFDEIMS